jgi:tetratricopeptide (TPR) repeat protein
MRFASRRPARWRRWLIVGLVLAGSGCQTERQGVEVNLSALARAYRERLDRKPSRVEAERIVAALPAQQLNDLGVLYEREGRLDRAAWAYQRAVWRDLRFAPGYVNLGNVLRKQGKTEEALYRYRQAMAADARNFEAVNNFADLCGETGTHLEEAIERLRAMVEEEGREAGDGWPEAGSPRELLPYGGMGAGDRPLSSYPEKRAYGLDTLGWLYHLRGDEVRAARTLGAAREAAAPDDQALRAMIEAHLATVEEALKQPASTAGGEAAPRS